MGKSFAPLSGMIFLPPVGPGALILVSATDHKTCTVGSSQIATTVISTSGGYLGAACQAVEPISRKVRAGEGWHVLLKRGPMCESNRPRCWAWNRVKLLPIAGVDEVV